MLKYITVILSQTTIEHRIIQLQSRPRGTPQYKATTNCPGNRNMRDSISAKLEFFNSYRKVLIFRGHNMPTVSMYAPRSRRKQKA